MCVRDKYSIFVYPICTSVLINSDLSDLRILDWLHGTQHRRPKIIGHLNSIVLSVTVTLTTNTESPN